LYQLLKWQKVEGVPVADWKVYTIYNGNLSVRSHS
jgi:hypothetical protein